MTSVPNLSSETLMALRAEFLRLIDDAIERKRADEKPVPVPVDNNKSTGHKRGPYKKRDKSVEVVA